MTPVMLQSLLEERDLLLERIDALDVELDQGGLDDEEHANLRASYVERTATVLRLIEAAEQRLESGEATRVGAATAGAPGAAGSRWNRLRRRLGRRSSQRWLITVAACCFIGLAGLLAVRLAGIRLPGQSATGNDVLPTGQRIREELQQASELGTEGEVLQSIEVYNRVLAVAPHQPEALTYRGWLERLIGLRADDAKVIAAGDASVAEATVVSPSYPDGHALYGVILLEDDHDLKGSIAQFRDFLRDGPEHSLLVFLKPTIEAAFHADHLAVPQVVSSA